MKDFLNLPKTIKLLFMEFSFTRSLIVLQSGYIHALHSGDKIQQDKFLTLMEDLQKDIREFHKKHGLI